MADEHTTRASDVTAALHKIKRDLDWRGPSGKQSNFVVLIRVEAEALLRYIAAMEDTLLKAAGMMLEKKDDRQKATTCSRETSKR